ncbi:MAG: hypothetical protein Ct9H300mP27_00200 [Chloroflexota bacterium]|nr:MAG: hypothetical protein Ct9H300mP27_00200 [Chloroflexota bacterium]
MFSAQLALKAMDGYVVLAGAGDAPEKWTALWKLVGRDELISDTRYLGLNIAGDFYFNNIVPASRNGLNTYQNKSLTNCYWDAVFPWESYKT